MFRTVALTIALLATPASALCQEEHTFPGSVLESVATIRVYGDSGREIGLGSGFFLTDGRVATNAHVVQGAAWVEVYDRNDRLLMTTTHASVVSTRLDVAILPAPSNTRPGLPFRDTASRVGESVWVVGSPQGLSGSVSNGVVSAEREFEGRTLLQISAPISSGSSGGPVLDAQGRVLGMASSFLASGQNLNFAVRASDLEVLSEGPGSELSFPPLTQEAVTLPAPPPAEAEASGLSWGWAGFSWAYPIAQAVSPPITALSASLGASDPNQNGQHFDLYEFSGRAGEVYRIGVWTEDFDPIVAIFASEDLAGGFEEGWSIEDDDGGTDLNSLMDVELPHSGRYVVRVASWGDSGYGEYSLSIWDEATLEQFRAGAQATPDLRPDSDRWSYVATDRDDATWWIDLEGVRTSPGLRSTWILQMKPSPERSASGGMTDESRTLRDYDCSGWRSRLRSLVLYHRGDVVESLSWGPFEAEWHAVIPESIGEAAIEMVCGG